jgi:hypothetical protein
MRNEDEAKPARNLFQTSVSKTKDKDTSLIRDGAKNRVGFLV